LTASDKQERLAARLLWLIPVMWSVNYLVARKAPGIVEPHMLALGRWGLAGGILAFLARKELWQARQGIADVWHEYLALGALGMLVCGAWVYLGAKTTGAMNIALIYAASPVLIAVGAVLFLGERLSRVQVLGVAMALLGVLTVITQGRLLAIAQVNWVAGDGWIVMAMVSWALYALLQKKWPSPLSATARLAAICAGGVVAILPFAVWEIYQPSTPPWSVDATALVLAAALIPGLGAYWLYGWTQRILGASRVAVTLYLSPLVATLLAWGVLHEPLSVHHATGLALVLPGVYLASRKAPTL
jgi:drug/metabolite transporter (DMT)-like permease